MYKADKHMTTNEKGERITAPLPNAGGQQSICKSGRFAGTIIFAPDEVSGLCLANGNKHSIFVSNISVRKCFKPH
jgi:hypothetical protein